MTPTFKAADTINGKKICWNYRKGRCRFGHNCVFGHDSDVVVSKTENATKVLKLSSTTPKVAAPIVVSAPPEAAEGETEESSLLTSDHQVVYQGEHLGGSTPISKVKIDSEPLNESGRKGKKRGVSNQFEPKTKRATRSSTSKLP